MPERQLRQRIRMALRHAYPGALVMGWPANMWTGAGWPDLLFLEWPLLLGLEVKQGRRSKPTPVQLARHELLRAHHIPVFVTFGPRHAVDIIATLKERLPMAFDPSLLAELEAALNDSPVPDLIAEQANADQNAFDLANGTATIEAPEFLIVPPLPVVLDADAPAPDIEDLTAAIVANEEIAQAETEELLDASALQTNVLLALKDSVDALTLAIRDLIINLDPEADVPSVPQTVEAPAPRRRTRRS